MKTHGDSYILVTLLLLILLAVSPTAGKSRWVLKADSILPIDPYAAYQLYTQYSPSDHYRIAQSLLALGEIDRAIPELESAGDRFNLGRAYFLKGDWETAYKILSRLESDEAHLLAGLCMDGINSTLALNHFLKAREGLSMVDDYLSLKIADQLLRLGKSREALATLTQAIERHPQMKQKAEVLEELSTIYLELGYPMLARKQLLHLLPHDYPRYRYSVALIEEDMGWRPDEAFREILKGYPKTVWARQSFEKLVQLGCLEMDDYLYGGIAYSNQKKYEKASQLFNTYLKFFPHKELALFELGVVYYRMRKYDDACELFSKIKGKLREDAIFYLAKCKERLGKPEETLLEYRKIPAKSPNYPKASYYAGRLYERSERFDEAISSYRDLRKRYPVSQFSDDVCFRTGFILYSLGRYREAVQEFKEFIELYPESPLLEGVLYWMAKSVREKKEREEIVTRLIGINPLGYYSKLACENFGLVPPELQLNPELPSVDSLTDERLRRGYLFLKLGLLPEAEREFSEANPEHKNLLALIYHQHAVSSKAISYAYRAGEGFLKILYPRTYIITLRDISQGPYLMFALVREESRFDPLAISRSGAIGVAQIMPSTGEMIAKELGYKDFRPESLFEVETNLRFGSFYLEKMLKRFGKLEYALAAYNAGPHRVEEWLSQIHHNSMDEFVEKIPFSETRKYVKRVMESYWNYTRIYGPQSEE